MASLGLGASASTINTAAAIAKYGAGTLIAIVAMAVVPELIGHGIEGHARAHFAEEGGQKMLDSVFQTAERPTIASLQAKQTSCIVKGIKYVGNRISSFVSDKVKVLDESWENFQIGIRNGGVADIVKLLRTYKQLTCPF
ncbi:MAG: hypothetical protein K2W97_01600 [Chthoniobacterales bacterium]|nr:hypothetical protein [Chthoniobacterales bacterium]